ncbi:leucine-rich repeat-containing protein 24-like [Melanaphis sacchari]|nr:leucine-rich repeat-containing protein 24-like [Melanaphis sacchari]
MLWSRGNRGSRFLAAAAMLALVVPSSVRSFEGCPAVCSCKWKGGRRTVECADRALITVPMGVDPETQVLDLSGNNLQILPNETFLKAGLANLQKAYLRNCRIGQIDDSAFRGLTNLIELDLSNNMLTSVPSYVFRDVPYLRDLSVAGNPIQKIEARAFADCPSVVKVDASHCGLQSVAGHAFDGVVRLETLRINGNRLTELSATVLESLNKLRSVELHDNPWVCDCHLRPMKLWLSGNNVPYNQPALCSGGPDRLSGKPLTELDVEDFDCRPDVRAESRYVEVTEGHNVTVRCRVEPGSMAHIAWYLNGRRLQGAGTPAIGYPGAASANPRMFVVDGVDDEDGSRRSEMTLTDVRREDAGQYSCLAENRAGNSEANFTVYVTDRPSVIMSTFGSAHVNGVAAAMAALIVFILVLIALTVMRIRRTGYPADTKPTEAAGNRGSGKPSTGSMAMNGGGATMGRGGGGYGNSSVLTGGGKMNPALDISSVIERNYDPDLEPGLGSVCTPTGSYHVAGLDLIHDHDASRLEMCDSPMSSTAKPPPSYYSGARTVSGGGNVRPYDDRTPIIGTGSAGDAYSVGTGSDEVFSYNSQQQLHYGGGGGHYAQQQQAIGGGSVNSDYPADYGLPIIPAGHHLNQSSTNVSQYSQHPQQHPHQQQHQQYYNNNNNNHHHQQQQQQQQLHHPQEYVQQQQDVSQQPSVKTLRVWQRGVPVLPTTPSLQRFANRTSPTTPGTDV